MQKGLDQNEAEKKRLETKVLDLYCKLILLEMSHSSMMQKYIINKEGQEILMSLEEFSFSYN